MSDWEQQLSALLPVFGHRNWVVVADSAYPAQSKPGIETIATGEGQMEAVIKVWGAIAGCKHVRANVYADREIAFVEEADAPGIGAYRDGLKGALEGARPRYIPHEEIIAKLDRAAEVFRILIVKTAMTIPYTSVFFELDCGYWSAEAEERLRRAMGSAETK
ncbi:MAG TPA: RbsD/FucU domain-containing protein [Terracidiphilus sp.]|nr:RbsD/FucU domain-containing protein [Terracidiphilus sp.]